jgi:hypothetical protein
MNKSYLVYRNGHDANGVPYKSVAGSVVARSLKTAEAAAAIQHPANAGQWMTIVLASDCNRQDLDDAATMNAALQMLARC